MSPPASQVSWHYIDAHQPMPCKIIDGLRYHMMYVPQDPKATSPSPCDVLALQKCLEQNKGDRKKCAQEVQAFQQACSKAKTVT